MPPRGMPRHALDPREERGRQVDEVLLRQRREGVRWPLDGALSIVGLQNGGEALEELGEHVLLEGDSTGTFRYTTLDY